MPDTKDILPLLSEMQTAHEQMVVVVDEYGGTAGVITIEDIVEEIVGEIEDEFDPDNKYLTRLSRREWLVDGRFSCDDAVELGWPIEESDEYETIAGWILEVCDGVPIIGETFEVEGYRFRVQSMRGQRISLIRVIAPEEPAASDAPDDAAAGQDGSDAAAADRQARGAKGEERAADDEIAGEPRRGAAFLALGGQKFQFCDVLPAKRLCGLPTALVASVVIPAMGSAHPGFRRIDVTNLEKMATGCRALPAAPSRVAVAVLIAGRAPRPNGFSRRRSSRVHADSAE